MTLDFFNTYPGLRWSFLALALCVAPAFGDRNLVGQEAKQEAESLKVETVLADLKHPFSVAVEAESGDVYVAEAGRQRVFKWVDSKVLDVVTGFAKSTFELDSSNGKRVYSGGPVAIDFYRNQLIVGTAGEGAGKDKVLLFILEKDAKLPLDLKAAKSNDSLEKSSKTVAEGGFLDLVAGNGYFFASCFEGDLEKSWVSRAQLKKDKFTVFRRFFETKKAAGVPRSLAIGRTAEGYLMVGNMGEADGKADSQLVMYEVKSGKPLERFELQPIADVIDVEVAKDSQRVFLLDHNFASPESGGLYELIANQDGIGGNVKKLLDLNGPTAMAFGKNGELYVTLAGDPAEESANGKLLKITGLSAEKK